MINDFQKANIYRQLQNNPPKSIDVNIMSVVVFLLTLFTIARIVLRNDSINKNAIHVKNISIIFILLCSGLSKNMYKN